MMTRFGRIETKYSARGIPSYSLEIWHDGLKKHRVIKGDCEFIIESKAKLQAEEWEQRWETVSAREQEKAERAACKRMSEESKELAARQTLAAQSELDALGGILKATLEVDDAINWESLKNKSPFPEAGPGPLKLPAEPKMGALPQEPSSLDKKYIPKLGFLDKIIPSRKARILEEVQAQLAADKQAWKGQCAMAQKAHEAALQSHANAVSEAKKVHAAKVAAWEIRRDEYLREQASDHAQVDAKREAYEALEPEAIIDYCDLVLSSSNYPEYFPQEFELDYDVSSKTLILDYQLPAPEALPRLKAVKYVASRDEFEESFITDAQATKLYDDVLYQVSLRTVHELFEADVIDAIDAVAFNGIVTAVDRATGKNVTACVLSLRANKAEFSQINLEQVEPKACFKSLKGVGSSKLHGLAPIAPIMQLRKDDGRFVSAYEVANTLDESVNLAAMAWEDFEHLIRELFEQEFSSTGGEVKVTQASRDGGVDAVAFDPDPIRGGKIVIQAKRYTNTVGVGAVRDLYGTVLNEGATKGILVTTSDYGPDSYAFANGKPLVLLSGANLLHMLQKHGHQARINLQEAKSMASAQ
ncbi:restriction endonuclease [Pseudomonas aeruginosa]|uniref:restriction endonuclease n=1 Tax=Pseudomonas aeruginosa TaxID=287 RepID=UPI001F28AA70|nr:restriction endonuclease [Pseudomonas aeruginosa]